MNSHPNSKSHGLRIFGFVLVAALVFAAGRVGGWYSSRKPIAENQRGLVEKLKLLNAHYYYDYQLVDESTGELIDPDDPEAKIHWLAPYMGVDWFHDIFYVSFAQFDSFKDDGGVATKRDEINDIDIEPLSDLLGLRWLALSGTNVTDTAIPAIAQLPRLEKLWLSQTQITDASLMSLSKCKLLRELAIEITPTTDKGLEFIVGLPRLRLLSLGSPYFSPQGLQALGQATELEELYIDRLPADDVLMSLLATHPLRTLSLRQTAITDAGVQQLAQVESLKDLRLDGTRITDEAFSAVTNWSNVESLSVSRTTIGDAALMRLEPCRNLKSLNVKSTLCTLKGVLELFVEKQQRSIGEALEVVFGAKRNSDGAVLSLDLSAVVVGDNDIDLLAELSDLEWLEMSGSRLTDAGAAAIGALQLPNLSLVRVDGASIGDEGLASLLTLPNLRNLHVNGTRISSQAIADAKERYPTVRIYKN